MRRRNLKKEFLLLALLLSLGGSGSGCEFSHPPDICPSPYRRCWNLCSSSIPPPSHEIAPSPCCQEFDDYAFFGLSEEDRRGLGKLKDFSWKSFAYIATSAILYPDYSFTYGVIPVNFVFSPVALLEILYLYTSFALPDTQTVEELKGFLPFYAKASSEPPLPVQLLHTIFSNPRKGTGGERRVLNNIYLVSHCFYSDPNTYPPTEEFLSPTLPKEWILGSRPQVILGSSNWVQATVNRWVSAETGGFFPEFFPFTDTELSGDPIYRTIRTIASPGILINAFHFRSSWASGILGSLTLQEPFTGLRRKDWVWAFEMHKDGFGRVLKKEGTPGYEAFSLDLAEETRTAYWNVARESAEFPYHRWNFLFLMIMPPQGREFLEWFPEFIASREYDALLKEITRGTEARAVIPCFRVRSFYLPSFWGVRDTRGYDLDPSATTPGIFPTLWGIKSLVRTQLDPDHEPFLPYVFQWTRGLAPFIDPVDLFHLYHKVEVNVNAYGINLSSPEPQRRGVVPPSTDTPLSVAVNRPFLFVVYHFPTQIPVLMGMVVDPPEEPDRCTPHPPYR